MNGKDLDTVEKFSYLGAIVTNEGGIGDVNNRLPKARATFTKLKGIWKSNIINRRTKIKLYNVLVKSALLYGCESWKRTKGEEKEIDIFQNKCLRWMLNIKWQERVTTEDLLKRADTQPISKEIRCRKWKWLGHILRKDQGDDCNIALTWAPEGKRRRGRPNTTWRRMVEKERNMGGWTSWGVARAAAANRDRWRHSVEALCVT
ncbi:uncharacterized protein LOC117105993 [Anneissia japonica]|uniref:uncharacterized protein LOC117105993 n=1 Tax=Anneissia japonica TaxID=1529436 RepID=UPI001425B3B6|nr:uncharacterized protein LOC117105993 [Anneissia japonica]